MKCVVRLAAPPLTPFPRLMVGRSSRRIVLFTDPFSGFVVADGPVGDRVEVSSGDAGYDLFHGAITLENEPL